MDYASLKERQRKERDNHSQGLALRVHRALSWLERSEQCEDEDGQFIFLWIAFNAAYAAETGGRRSDESSRYRDFLFKLQQLDSDKNLFNLVWTQYTSAIRLLLDNQYVYQPFWDFQNGFSDDKDWEESFSRDKKRAHRALSQQDTAGVLSVVFYRLYTLRNQLVHGGATWNSSANREQMRDACRFLKDFVPIVIELMLDNANELWGDAAYPVVDA